MGNSRVSKVYVSSFTGSRWRSAGTKVVGPGVALCGGGGFVGMSIRFCTYYNNVLYVPYNSFTGGVK